MRQTHGFHGPPPPGKLVIRLTANIFPLDAISRCEATRGIIASMQGLVLETPFLLSRSSPVEFESLSKTHAAKFTRAA